MPRYCSAGRYSRAAAATAAATFRPVMTKVAVLLLQAVVDPRITVAAAAAAASVFVVITGNVGRIVIQEGL